MYVLYSWLGNSDLKAVNGEGGLGPVADALLHMPGEPNEYAVLMFDHLPGETQAGERYLTWLNERLASAGKTTKLVLRPLERGDPTCYGWVFNAMRTIVADSEKMLSVSGRRYLIGPGTPTMAACSLILSRMAACAGELWQVDIKSELGCRRLELPFDICLADAPDPQSGRAERWVQALDLGRDASPIVASPAMIRAWGLAKRAAACRWPVLILGSTGTGKEVVARYIYKSSKLSGPFRTVNCGAIPENLIEAELFGYKKGAYTGATQDRPGIFEAAAGGMVFLDEVGELPLAAQTKFLRVLQEGVITRLGEHQETKIDCRILAATHRNLWQAVREGRFREDLYYRLAGIIIDLPDLAERREDLEAMIKHFWSEIVKENPGFPGRTLREEARQRLLTHSWPGNVRELRATLVRAAFQADGPEIGARDIESALDSSAAEKDRGAAATSRPAPPAPDAAPVRLKDAVESYKRHLVEQALSKSQGNQARAARALGISPQHLGRLLKR